MYVYNVCVCACVSVYDYLHMFICSYLYVHVFTDMHVYIHIYICIYIYIVYSCHLPSCATPLCGGLHMILPLPMLFGVWHAKGGSGRVRSLRNGRAIVLQQCVHCMWGRGSNSKGD